MKAKIAIAGWPQSNKTLLANTLSNMTGIPFIRNKTIYEWRKTYNFPELIGWEWSDMFLISLSSLVERVETESKFDSFISDGASFTEIVYLKSNFAKQGPNKMQSERNKMLESLEKVSLSYAAGKYDFIIHACANDPLCVNGMYEQLYVKYKLPYKMYYTESINDALPDIITDLGLPVKLSIESSIYKARTNLFGKVG